MAHRTEPPMKAMATSFWVIVPLALVAGFLVSMRASSLLLKGIAFLVSFWVTLRLLGIASTFVMARIYKIPIDSNPEHDEIVELRARARILMKQLGLHEDAQRRLIAEFLLNWNDRDMVEFLESEVRVREEVDVSAILDDMARFRESRPRE